MIAYNTEWLNNLLIGEELQTAFKKENITTEEYSAAKKLYPVGFYTPNIYIRAGLFILTLIIIGFSYGLIFILFNESNIGNIFSILCFTFSVLCYVTLELIIKKKHHFKSGVDDALLWASGGLLYAAIFLVSDMNFVIPMIFIFIYSIYLTHRFANALMGAVILYSGLLILSLSFFTLLRYTGIFVNLFLFIISGFTYFLSKKAALKINFKFYKNAFIVIQVVALILAYKNINYYFVLFYMQLNDGKGASNFASVLSILIWILTIALPFCYIYMGIKNKDRLIGRVGLVLIVAIVFTIRQFYSLLPIEILMLSGGVILIALAYYLSEYLQPEKYGFTSLPVSAELSNGRSQIESLIIAETFSGMPQPTTSTTNFGGGNFGGGGASGEF